MSVPELEWNTCHAFSLASRWLSGCSVPRGRLFIDATSNTSVSEIRFVPGHAGQWILTVSKGVWDVITIWDVTAEPQKCCEWSPRGAIFNGFALNADETSEATLAVSVMKEGEHMVDIMSVDSNIDGTYHFRILNTIQSNLKPIALQGDLLAISDDAACTMIWDWRAGTSAILEHPPDDLAVWHSNCIQVIFAHDSILVVRARFIHLFPEPDLHDPPQVYMPIARHSFGWIDGVSVAPTQSLSGSDMSPGFPSLSILVRGESDNPWSSGLHSLDLFTLRPNPSYRSSDIETSSIPYIFPPALTTQVQAVCGHLRCRAVILGRCGTAVWIQPRDWAVVGLLSNEEFPAQAIHTVSGHESLVAATFPGPLAASNPIEDVTRSRTLYTNHLNNWTSLDYDEALGRIALGSSFGRVLILEL